jgi:hypothetical protein
MTQAPASIFKIPTESPQPARGRPSRALKLTVALPKAASRVAGIETRAAMRGDGEVIELDHGITVYPPKDKGAGGGRSGTRTASGSSASPSRRRSSPRSWRRSGSGFPRVERPRLPFRHPVHHPAGNRGNSLLRDFRPVDFLQVRGDLPVREAFRGQGNDHVLDPGQPPLPFATIFDSKLESRSRGTEISTGPASVITVFARCPFRELSPSRPAGSCLE